LRSRSDAPGAPRRHEGLRLPLSAGTGANDSLPLEQPGGGGVWADCERPGFLACEAGKWAGLADLLAGLKLCGRYDRGPTGEGPATTVQPALPASNHDHLKRNLRKLRNLLAGSPTETLKFDLHRPEISSRARRIGCEDAQVAQVAHQGGLIDATLKVPPCPPVSGKYLSTTRLSPT
jgi:hypothetical protein